MHQNLTISLFLSFCLFSLGVQSQNPLAIPDTLSGSNLNLTLQNGTVQFIPGNVTNTMGANGNILGPTLMLYKNQPVSINVDNQLGMETTIHWHGLHVSPEHDGGPHVVIQPNTVWNPSFTVKDPANTSWYHPHLHHHTNEHVQKGIAGFIIVKDAVEAALNLPRTYGVDDIPLVVQTKCLDANKQIVTTTTALDTLLLVNGTRKPYVSLPAQYVRLRLLNGSSERYYNFGFTNNKPFWQIGCDGGLLAAPVQLTRLMMAPGERAEVVLDLGGMQGQTIFLRSFASELPNAIYGAAQPGMGAGQTIPNYTQNPLNGNDFNILEMQVVAPTNNPVTSIPTTLTTITPWTAAQSNLTRTFTFSPVNMGPTAIQGPFFINNQLFDMMVMNFETTQDQVEIWQLTNQTPIGHPFHIHGNSFYVLDINGVAPPPSLSGRKDVVHVPGGNGTVRVITKYENYAHNTIPYMYHCHILTHEEDGMMGQFLVKTACALTVTTQPQSQTVAAGSSVQFTVASSSPSSTYQWQSDVGFGFQNLSNAGQYGGVNTATLTVSNLTITNNNQAFRCLVQEGSCADTSNVAILGVGTDAIDEVLASTLYVYPNPVGDFLLLFTANPKPQTFYLYDLVGKTVMTGSTEGKESRIAVSQLAPGTYFLGLEGSSRLLKVVKQ